MKRLLFSSLLLVLASFLFAGGKREVSSTTASGGNTKLKNGTYLATYSAADPYGWQPFMEMVVKGGRIDRVVYDYVSPNGIQLKTGDASYNSAMLKGARTNPQKAYPELSRRIVAAQSSKIDVVTGATESSKTAMDLADALIGMARTGKSHDLVLPMEGTYTAEDKADNRGGWIGRLQVTFGRNGEISAVTYDEIRKAGGRIISFKSKDKEYAKEYQASSGINQSDAYARLSKALLATRKLATVDAVSGATTTSGRFNNLIGAIRQERRGVSLATIRRLIK